MTEKTEISSEVLAALKKELPGLRTEVHRRIANLVSTRINKKISDARAEAAGLRRQLSDRDRDERTAAVKRKQAVTAALKTIQEIEHGG